MERARHDDHRARGKIFNNAHFNEKPEAPEYFAVPASWLTKHGIALGGS